MKIKNKTRLNPNCEFSLNRVRWRF